MSANSSAFLSHLKQSGLLAADQLAEVHGRVAADSVDDCISGLVERGWLTEFQVKQLHAGQSKGLVLGQYHILDELGRGGYGCVYKARHKLMDRVVALKVIAPHLVANDRARTWFRREVFAATQLNHPNIVLAYDADEVDDVLFFAMEYIDGSNLAALVRQRGALPIGMACELMNQAAKALQYAHEKGMVHRDIKPANLLIPNDVIAQSNTDLPPNTEARSVLVKIVDFGLARLQKSSPHETLELQNEKAFIGTPSYVSPEQARNVHDVDIRSDLYSLGCTMYFALAGRPPFVGESVFELLAQHLESEPEPLERRRPEIPPALASIVRRLMAKKPEKRFQTPAELIGELGFFFSNDRGANRPSAAFRMDVVARPLPESVPTPEPHPTHVVAPVTEIRPTDSYPANADGPVQELPGGPTAIIDFQSAVPREANGASVDADTQACSVGDPSTANGATAPEPHADATAMIDPAAESPVASFHSLLLDWRLWTSVVEALFRGRTPEMSEAIYRELHRQFLEECRTYAGRGAADQRVLVQNMADLVQPWLSLASFPTGDRATLTSLHAKCRQLNAAMGSRAPTQSHWLLAVVISVCGIALLGWFASQGFGSWIVDAVSRLLQ